MLLIFNCMAKLMEKLQKTSDTLEWKLAGLALNSFVSGVILSDIPRAISEKIMFWQELN